MKDNIEETLSKFFRERNWAARSCDICGSQYYTKMNREHCGSYSCENAYSFLDISSPRAFIKLGDVDSKIKELFSERGYEHAKPMKIKRNNNERTLFSSTVGQIFDSLIYGKNEIINKKAFCFQPVIRLQEFHNIGKIEGLSTSFINVGTEHWNAPPEEHFTALDDWLDMLSKLGLYAGNIAFKYEYDLNDWGEITIPAKSLKINYGGLEIGIANYFFDIPQKNSTSATLSDINFGLERLIWAINKTDSYFDAIGPIEYVLSGDTPYLDSIRTLTLMSSSGVRPGPNNHGSKFKMIAKNATRPFEMLSLNELVSFYYTQWSKYVALENTVDKSLLTIRDEVDRQTNIYINQMAERKGKLEKIGRVSLDDIIKENSRSLSRIRKNIKRGDML